MRDALSLLDQAIAHAAGAVRAEDIRQMLGLADRTRVIDLFEALMRGDMAKALGELRDQYDSGADPAVVLSDLAEFTHFVTRVKVVPAVADDVSLAEAERTRGRAFAAQLSMRVLSRTWQMLFKGLAEVQEAGKPLAAAEMVLVRIAYAADLPTPDEVMRDIQQNGARVARAAEWRRRLAAAAPRAPQRSAARCAARFACARATCHRAGAGHLRDARRGRRRSRRRSSSATFPALIALADEKRDILMKSALERDVRLVRIEDGKLEIALEPSARKTLVQRPLAQDLRMDRPPLDGGGVGRAGRADRAARRTQQKQSELEQGVRADPLVQAVLARFPGAEIVGVRAARAISPRRDDACRPPAMTSRCRIRTTTAPRRRATKVSDG